MVEHLVGVSQGLVGIDAAGNHDQRNAVLLRIRHDVKAIGETWPNGCDKNPRLPGPVIGAFRHEPGGVLVLAKMKRYSRRFQRIHDGKHLTAGHPKGMPASGIVEAARENIGRTRKRGIHVVQSPSEARTRQDAYQDKRNILMSMFMFI
jgi:hypothetical protein